MADLPEVHQGEPHISAHNAEREVLNAIPGLVPGWMAETLENEESPFSIALAARVQEMLDGSFGQVQSLIDDSLDQVRSLPLGGAEDQVLAKASVSDGDATWVTPAQSIVSTVGEWQAAPLLFSEYFFAGKPSGAMWIYEFSPAWAGGNFTVQTVASASSTNRPSIEYCLRIPSNGGAANSYSRLKLDLNAIPALSGKVPSRIDYWYADKRQLSGGGPINKFYDGAQQRESITITDNSDRPWGKRSWPIGSINNDQIWESFVNGSANPDSSIYVTGIEIYGVPSLYKLNDVVRYNGTFWRSIYNDNPYTPGQQGWVAVT